MMSFKEVSNVSYVMKERMMQALRYFKEWTNQRVLVQVWVPIRNGDRYVLTTSEQPFVLDPDANGRLLHYRTVSAMHLFSFDEDDDGALGLPGRVFKLKLPEWTPNVQYYSSKEYPRLSYALLYNVRGSLALPIFEPSEQSCVGVVELITTSEMVNYAPEIDKVCRALEVGIYLHGFACLILLLDCVEINDITNLMSFMCYCETTTATQVQSDNPSKIRPTEEKQTPRKFREFVMSS